MKEEKAESKRKSLLMHGIFEDIFKYATHL